MKTLETTSMNTLEKAALLPEPAETKGQISTDYLPTFIHCNANTINEAVSLLKTYGERATLMAGGATLLREMKRRMQPAQHGVLINLKSITQPSLNYIIEDTACLRIGSTTRLCSIEKNEIVRQKYPLLAQSVHTAGFPQYRNMATIGGDLCQHVKCWYYQASGNFYHCRRKGGDACYALDGDNRYHAIYGINECCAVCASEVAPVLVAMGATAKLAGISEEQIIQFEDFFTPSGNVLQQTDILTEIQIPAPTTHSRDSFIKIGVRNEFDSTIVSVAVLATIIDKICSKASIVLGGVNHGPYRAMNAENVITGKVISRQLAKKAAQIATQHATPMKMNVYKLDLVETLVCRAITELI